MKNANMRKISLSVLLVLLILASVAAPSAAALSPKDSALLAKLRPASLPKPKGATSYPAELEVAFQGHETIVLKGTCSLEGELTDEEILDAIKQAANEHEDYGSADDAMNDADTVDRLSGKLTFSEEDQKRIVSNWLALVGADKVAALLGGNLPNYGGSDVVNAVTSMIFSGKAVKGLKSLSPKPSGLGSGAVINGVFISWEEYKKDQERYRDIVELANARARLRAYNGILNRILKDKMKDRTGWTIRIQNQVIKKQTYRTAPNIDVPYIYTSDVVLKKKDGNYEEPVGTYEGTFQLKTDLDLSDYDANFHKYLAEHFNDKIREAYQGLATPTMMWKPVSQSVNHPSENELTLENGNVFVSLENGLGGIYELPLDPMKLDITRYKVTHDMVSVIMQENEAVRGTLTWTEIDDSDTRTAYHQDHEVILNKLTGEKTETANTDDNPMPDIDIRTMLGFRLIVDLSER
ncbi:MAG: hypothetical protein ILO68_03910 [Clostridia bacterium]|nr:hypothetical protein [Clostridia bacterium]